MIQTIKSFLAPVFTSKFEALCKNGSRLKQKFRYLLLLADLRSERHGLLRRCRPHGLANNLHLRVSLNQINVRVDSSSSFLPTSMHCVIYNLSRLTCDHEAWVSSSLLRTLTEGESLDHALCQIARH